MRRPRPEDSSALRQSIFSLGTSPLLTSSSLSSVTSLTWSGGVLKGRPIGSRPSFKVNRSFSEVNDVVWALLEVKGTLSKIGRQLFKVAEIAQGHRPGFNLIDVFQGHVTDVVWAMTVQWHAGNLACKVIKYLQLFGLYLSNYTVVVIAIDRCSAVLDPLSQRTTARHRSRVLQQQRQQQLLIPLVHYYYYYYWYKIQKSCTCRRIVATECHFQPATGERTHSLVN